MQTMDQPGGLAPILRIHKVRSCRGYLFGLRQRPAIVTFSGNRVEAPATLHARAHAMFAPYLPQTEMTAPDRDALSPIGSVAAMQWIAALAAGIEEGTGGVVLQRAHVALASAKTRPTDATPPAFPGAVRGFMASPTVSPPLGMACLGAAIDLIRKVENGEVTEEDCAGIEKAVDEALASATQPVSNTMNTRHFIRAAFDLDIPVLPLVGDTVQYGYGQGAQLFRSTLSTVTPAVSATITRDKRLTSRLLSMAGYPVPRQVSVADADQSADAAEKLGYPVVLKVADMDQGIGVHVDLSDEAAVRNAYAAAAQVSRAVVVEEMIRGSDFRVNVLQGQVQSAVKRVPAAVTGDGTSTIRTLIEKENENPRRGSRSFSMLKTLQINDDMEAYLGRSGQTLDSVPQAGAFVQLRANANVSTGGTTEDATDRMHPEVAAICARVTRLLRLDIAGIDIITTDIGRPLSETGGAIIEVNAQPQVGITFPGVFKTILQAYCPAHGGARIVLALTDGSAAQAGLPDAVVRQDLFRSLTDPDRDVVSWVSDGADFVQDGLPVDRVHAVTVGPWSKPPGGLINALSLLAEHLRGPILIAPGHRHIDLVRKAAGKRAVEEVAPEAVHDRVAALREAG